MQLFHTGRSWKGSSKVHVTVEFLETREETAGAWPLAMDSVPCLPDSHLSTSSPQQVLGRDFIQKVNHDWPKPLFIFTSDWSIDGQANSSTNKIPGEIYRGPPFWNKEGA